LYFGAFLIQAGGALLSGKRFPRLAVQEQGLGKSVEEGGGFFAAGDGRALQEGNGVPGVGQSRLRIAVSRIGGSGI